MPWEYGGFSVNAMDSHGGWIASTRDMLKLLTAVDGFATKPDILQPATIATMVTPSANNSYYAKGWSVNPNNNWWHTGSLDGTASELVRTAGGYSWIIILNKRNINNGNFWTAVDNLGWNCLSATASWPTHDLMASPTINASAINFSVVTGNAITVDWTSGNGNSRLLLVKESSSINGFPLDGTDYTANPVYGSGSAIGTGNWVVYNGTGNTVTVTGLSPNKKYYFRLIEYNKNAVTGNNALYLLGGNAQEYSITSSSFTFTGNGNWSEPANWANGLIPPSVLPHGSQINIAPAGTGECVLDVLQKISSAASLNILAGKKFRVSGNLVIQ